MYVAQSKYLDNMRLKYNLGRRDNENSVSHNNYIYFAINQFFMLHIDSNIIWNKETRGCFQSIY